MGTAISVRLPKELAEQLDHIAKETERPRSYILQKALESYIEDYSDLQIARRARPQESLKGGSRKNPR